MPSMFYVIYTEVWKWAFESQKKYILKYKTVIDIVIGLIYNTITVFTVILIK